MPEWVKALLGVGVFSGTALWMRWWLIAKVTLWSFKAPDQASRDHALKLLRVLKPSLRREVPVPVEPHKDELLTKPKEEPPPLVGPGGDNAGQT